MYIYTYIHTYINLLYMYIHIYINILMYSCIHSYILSIIYIYICIQYVYIYMHILIYMWIRIYTYFVSLIIFVNHQKSGSLLIIILSTEKCGSAYAPTNAISCSSLSLVTDNTLRSFLIIFINHQNLGPGGTLYCPQKNVDPHTRWQTQYIVSQTLILLL